MWPSVALFDSVTQSYPTTISSRFEATSFLAEYSTPRTRMESIRFDSIGQMSSAATDVLIIEIVLVLLIIDFFSNRFVRTVLWIKWSWMNSNWIKSNSPSPLFRSRPPQRHFLFSYNVVIAPHNSVIRYSREVIRVFFPVEYCTVRNCYDFMKVLGASCMEYSTGTKI